MPKTSIIKGHNKLCLFGVSLNIRFLIIFLCRSKENVQKTTTQKRDTEANYSRKKNEIYQMNDLMLLT